MPFRSFLYCLILGTTLTTVEGICIFCSLPYYVLKLLEYLFTAIQCFIYICMCIDIFHSSGSVSRLIKPEFVVFASLRKPKIEYENLIDILQKAWAHFLRRHIYRSNRQVVFLFISNLTFRYEYNSHI